MTGQNEAVALTWEYAPSVGYFVRFRSEHGGVVAVELELLEVGRSDHAVWWEFASEAPPAFADASSAPATFEVTEGADSVVVLARGGAGGSARVVPPPTALAAPWTFEAQGGPGSESAILDATAGAWTLSATAPPDGWAWVAATSVRWLED